MTPCQEGYCSLLFFPATTSATSFWRAFWASWHGDLQGRSILPYALLLELQRNKDTVTCGKLSAEVTGFHQKRMLQKKYTFLYWSLIVKQTESDWNSDQTFLGAATTSSNRVSAHSLWLWATWSQNLDVFPTEQLVRDDRNFKMFRRRRKHRRFLSWKSYFSLLCFRF